MTPTLAWAIAATALFGVACVIAATVCAGREHRRARP